MVTEPDESIGIHKALKLCLEKKLIFAAYRLPGRKDTTLLVQKRPELTELNDISKLPVEGGFLVAPFVTNKTDKIFIIRPDIIIRNSVTESQMQSLIALPTGPLNGTIQVNPEETLKEDFIDQVEHILAEIRAGKYEKVVLSRVKNVEGDYTSRLADIFRLLCESYGNAFVYVFNIKGHCWIGATPEPLICSGENKFVTVSLAGTRPFSDANLDINNWNNKEHVEQEYVTTYIEKILDDFQVSGYVKNGPSIRKAGKLLHLCTEFIFSSDSVGSNLPALISALHPTSAVCGMPMEKALNFIQYTEKHNREYYSGFLGPVDLDDRLQLFVNLRCMRVYKNELILYVGGGITGGSIPEDEWEETEIKADTMLSIVQQVN
jgi:isochorismate synthase